MFTIDKNETASAKNNPGIALRTTGIAVAILSVFLIFAQLANVASFTLAPWGGLAIAFGLIVIGYMQKIAAK